MCNAEFADSATDYVRFCMELCMASQSVRKPEFWRNNTVWLCVREMWSSAGVPGMNSGGQLRSKRQYVRELENSFSDCHPHCMWKRLKAILNYRTLPVVLLDTLTSIPDKLNIFHAQFVTLHKVPE